MNPTVHRLYIGTFVVIVLFAFSYLVYSGISYYQTPLEERFFHDDHGMLKPSGPVGHGLGIIGTLLIIIGVSSYMIRKRNKHLRRIGVLKHWLEFHIFLCSLGPVLVLFHTAFKFGGIVSVSFWSMVAVVLSGIIGRFIYIQIPRTIQGRELSLNELQGMEGELRHKLASDYGIGNEVLDEFLHTDTSTDESERSGSLLAGMWKSYKENRKRVAKARKVLKTEVRSAQDRRQIIKLLKNEMALSGRIKRLTTMQELFKYWHVAHLPFALIMLIIMVIHVSVTIAFGYKWIF